MKIIKFKECPLNFKGVEVTKWNEHSNWISETIASYSHKKDKWERIQRLIDKFPEHVEVTTIDFTFETVHYAHDMIKVCADFLAGNVRNEDWFNEYVNLLNYNLSESYNKKVEMLPKYVTPCA